MIPILDSHHHIWRHADLPWLNGPEVTRVFGPYEGLRRDYLMEDLMADMAGSGIVGSVYLQVNWAPEQAVDEAAWVQSVSDRLGWPHGIVAYTNFFDDDSPETLKKLSAFPKMRGIRHQLHWHENDLYRIQPRPAVMNDTTWRKNFARLQDYGWSFDLQVFASQMKDAAKLAADYPGIPQILQHAGMAEDRSPEGLALWRDGMKALADQPNVFCKLSAFGTFIHENSEDHIAELIGQTLEIFPPERCLFGSNYPIEMLWTPYAPIVTAHRKAIAHLPEADQRAILHDTAVGVYKLEGMAAEPL
ncbi:MAG: amidohydrolase family protein [Rhodospirillaceae bacterium]|nr:amidohydrolase family protein [Rhodospirillaceae bacterium]